LTTLRGEHGLAGSLTSSFYTKAQPRGAGKNAHFLVFDGWEPNKLANSMDLIAL